MSNHGRPLDERDRAAEVWLRTHHGPEWYVGDASDEEWAAAYAAVDERTNPRDSGA